MFNVTFEDSQKTSRIKLIITTSVPLILEKYTALLGGALAAPFIQHPTLATNRPVIYIIDRRS